jgi:hypothetical protein
VVDRIPHNTQRLKLDTLDKIESNRKLVNLYKDEDRLPSRTYERYSEVQGSFANWITDSVRNVFIDQEYHNSCL